MPPMKQEERRTQTAKSNTHHETSTTNQQESWLKCPLSNQQDQLCKEDKSFALETMFE
jgi:hypothetical protein